MAESIQSLNQRYGARFIKAERVVTSFFTAEYFLRIIRVPGPRRYVFSFFAIIDPLSILPTYLGIFV